MLVTAFVSFSGHRKNAKVISLFSVIRKQTFLAVVDDLPDQRSFDFDFTSAYTCLQNVCSYPKALPLGKWVHSQLVNNGLHVQFFMGSLLVNMYGKCGKTYDACIAFDSMETRNIVSWTSMVGAYAKHGYCQQAIKIFREMQLENMHPNNITVVTVLSACNSFEFITEGRLIHAYSVEVGLDKEVNVGNALISMYNNCEAAGDAQAVFEKMHQKDVISWTAIISTYAYIGNIREAICVLDKMQSSGFKPNAVTLIAILGACTTLEEGKLVHALIGNMADCTVATTLISMYSNCGAREDASKVFDRMSNRSVVSWNAIIALYSNGEGGKHTFNLLEQLASEGLKPDKVTLINILHSCAQQSTLSQGVFVHAYLVQCQLDLDVIVGTAIANMYSRCGDLISACDMFDKLENRDVVLWTTIMAAYCLSGLRKKALHFFYLMNDHVKPNKVTLLTVLDACDLTYGKLMHANIVVKGFEMDVMMGSSLINMYGKGGGVEDAYFVFLRMPRWNLVTWNTMIASYALQGFHQEAFLLFQAMELEGTEPDKMTFISILDACTGLAAIEVGTNLHSHIIGSGLEDDIVIQNCLLKMYGKCGNTMAAKAVFLNMSNPDVISWTAMTAAYAIDGNGQDAIQLFTEMNLKGLQPDYITFVNLVFACTHACLVDEGCHYFASMNETYHVMPLVEHYGCMIDLFGRAKRVDVAHDITTNMPCEANFVAWMALLGSSDLYENLVKAEYI